MEAAADLHASLAASSSCLMVWSIRAAKTSAVIEHRSANELSVDPVSHYTERSEEISFNELLLNAVRSSEPATTHAHTELSFHDIKYLPSRLWRLMREKGIMKVRHIV